MVRLRIFRLILALLCICSGAPQGRCADTRQQIFNPRFRTLKIWNPDIFDAPPVLRMGSNDMLEILFDEIGEDNSYLEWRLLHCNADWQPSMLVESEYVDGFNARRIEDYAFSTATYVHYVNYRIVLPDPELPILRSGNYLLQVYNPDQPDVTLLQARFRVSENETAIAGGYNARTDRGYNDQWQQLAVSATVDRSDGANPYQDYRLELTQNNSSLSSRTIPVPLRVNGDRLIYEHSPQLIFPGGNEYLRFESVSNLYPGMNVDSLKYMGTNYHVWLRPDEPRSYKEYVYDQSQHGRFLIREWNATDSNVGADYITVHFLLKMPRMASNEIYVDGEMTNGLFNDSNRMTYDSDSEGYVLQMPLKQGAYNYRYLIKGPDGSFRPIDGDKWQTANQYEVMLWERRPNDRADRLIGFSLLNPF